MSDKAENKRRLTLLAREVDSMMESTTHLIDLAHAAGDRGAFKLLNEIHDTTEVLARHLKMSSQ